MATIVGFGGRPDPALPPVQGDPLLVDHLEGNRRWRDRYRGAVERGNAEPGRSPTPPLLSTPTEPMVYVQWLDSSMRHEQVDGDKLPTPSVLHTVGWLAAESDEFVTVAREQNTDPDSYRWRGSVSIPRRAILALEVVGGV